MSRFAVVAFLFAGCGRIGIDELPSGPLRVEPTYPQAPGWNDYVRRDVALPTYAQAGTPCDGSEPGLPAVCTHGGEQRKVVLNGLTRCDGATGSDALGAFQWTCDDRDGRATLYATGLRRGMGLRDLLDASGWKPNDVTVRFPSGPAAETAPDTWWTTPVVPLPDNSNSPSVALTQPGTIYVLASSRASGGYSIEADRVAVVTLAGATLHRNLQPVNCDLTTGAGGANACLITAASRRLLWVEGSYDGGDVTVMLGNPQRARIHGLRVTSGVVWGIALVGGVSSWSDDILVANSAGLGFALYQSQDNVVSELRAFGNGTSMTTGATGLFVDNSTASIFTDVVSANNWDSGVIGFEAEGNNTFSHVTAANNGYAGLVVYGTVGHDTVVHALGVNNILGFNLTGPASVLADAATSRNDVGLCVPNSDAILERGFVVGHNGGSDCRNLTSCAAEVACNTFSNGAVEGSGLDAMLALRGKVVTDDAVNQSDANGSATTATITDWAGFEHPMRGWGADGASFADVSNRQVCTGACRIWDWRRSAGDTTLAVRDGADTPDTSALVPDQPCPPTVDGDAVIQDALGNVFLANALELLGDGVGDDDGLCESGERCIRSEFFGAHEDAGVSLTAKPCRFHDGQVTGVQMFGDGS